jgi:ribonuclease T1
MRAFAFHHSEIMSPMNRCRMFAGLCSIALAICMALAQHSLQARENAARDLATIALADLPEEAREALQRIRQGGPFPYARDGIAFGNREGLLPRAPRGTYREFTVKTPGRRDRGARRIVASSSGEFYYTADHYLSFRRIVQ